MGITKYTEPLFPVIFKHDFCSAWYVLKRKFSVYDYARLNITLNSSFLCISLRIHNLPVAVAARSKAWKMSSVARRLGSWVRFQLSAWMFAFILCLCVGSGLATGWSHVQGVLPTVYRIKKLKWNEAIMDDLCSKVRATGEGEGKRGRGGERERYSIQLIPCKYLLGWQIKTYTKEISCRYIETEIKSAFVRGWAYLGNVTSWGNEYQINKI
jgi:hypothetical protein